MTKHQRVHMIPVAVRARFCVRERFSAGRQKSLIPAMTRAHCANFAISHMYPSPLTKIMSKNFAYDLLRAGVCRPLFHDKITHLHHRRPTIKTSISSSSSQSQNKAQKSGRAIAPPPSTLPKNSAGNIN